jgi:hypothetical protein
VSGSGLTSAPPCGSLQEVHVAPFVRRLALPASLMLACGYVLAANTGFLHNAPISRMNAEA